jgi:hypothetical protein
MEAEMRELRTLVLAALVGVAVSGCTSGDDLQAKGVPIAGTLKKDRCTTLVNRVTTEVGQADQREQASDEYCNNPGDDPPVSCEDAVRQFCAEASLSDEECTEILVKCQSTEPDPGEPVPGEPDPYCVELVWQVCTELGADEATCEALVREHCFADQPVPCEPPPPQDIEICVEKVGQACRENGWTDEECEQKLQSCYELPGNCLPPDPTEPDPCVFPAEPDPVCVDEIVRSCAEAGIDDDSCKEIIEQSCFPTLPPECYPPEPTPEPDPLPCPGDDPNGPRDPLGSGSGGR